MTQLSAPAQCLLVLLLARYESPWRPVRDAGDKGAAIHAARQRSLRSGSGDDRTRKAAERQRNELAAAGYLRDGALTDDGKRIARSWTWPYLAAEMFAAIARIRECGRAGDCRPGGWVPETLMAGCSMHDGPEATAALQGLLIPALADQAVESSSTTCGNVFYRMTADDCEKSIALPDTYSVRDDVHALYLREYRDIWRAILNDRAYYQEIGPIPIPASGELLSGRDPRDTGSRIPPLAELAS